MTKWVLTTFFILRIQPVNSLRPGSESTLSCVTWGKTELPSSKLWIRAVVRNTRRDAWKFWAPPIQESSPSHHLPCDLEQVPSPPSLGGLICSPTWDHCCENAWLLCRWPVLIEHLLYARLFSSHVSFINSVNPPTNPGSGVLFPVTLSSPGWGSHTS